MYTGSADKRLGHQTLVEQFHSARTDPALAVLEEFQPLKPAIRFGAQMEHAIGMSLDELTRLGLEHGPDIAPVLKSQMRLVPKNVFQELAPVPPQATRPSAGR